MMTAKIRSKIRSHVQEFFLNQLSNIKQQIAAIRRFRSVLYGFTEDRIIWWIVFAVLHSADNNKRI